MSNEKKFNIFEPEAQPKLSKEQEVDLAKKQQEYVDLLKKRLQGKSLMVATPMFGGQCLGSYTKSCLDLAILATRIGLPITFKYLFNESLIQRARNYLVDVFYRSDFTHLLFIDADISFIAQDAIALLSLCGETDESGKGKYDIIGVPYPKKSIAWEKVYDAARSGIVDSNPTALSKFVGDFAFNPVKGGGSFKLNEPLEVMETGTGFMCITKNTIEQFRKKFPKKKYLPDHARSAHFDGTRPIYAIFDCVIDPVSNRFLSEDYFFCQEARKIGLQVWICPWMELQHTGTYTFDGSIVHQAQLGTPINPSGISPKHQESVKKAMYNK